MYAYVWVCVYVCLYVCVTVCVCVCVCLVLERRRLNVWRTKTSCIFICEISNAYVLCHTHVHRVTFMCVMTHSWGISHSYVSWRIDKSDITFMCVMTRWLHSYPIHACHNSLRIGHITFTCVMTHSWCVILHAYVSGLIYQKSKYEMLLSLFLHSKYRGPKGTSHVTFIQIMSYS